MGKTERLRNQAKTGGPLRFVFWNIHVRPSNVELITRYGAENAVDIIALCEADFTGTQVFPSDRELHGYRWVPHIKPDIRDIQVLAAEDLAVRYTMERKRFCILGMDVSYHLNFAVVHLNSDLHSSGGVYRMADIITLKQDLLNEEGKHNSKNTLITGDFNENIWGPGIIWGPTEQPGLQGFHAKLFRSGVKPVEHLHDWAEEGFYNPMLNVYRDSADDTEAKGTYYYNSGIEWFCYDQVVMKHPLVEKFDTESLQILSRLGNTPLVRKHRPVRKISDHMPLYFELKG